MGHLIQLVVFSEVVLRAIPLIWLMLVMSGMISTYIPVIKLRKQRRERFIFIFQISIPQKLIQLSLRGLYPAPTFHMESMWNPCLSRWIPPIPYGICFGWDLTYFGDSIPPIFHME
jgi:hypothetical protein